MASNTLKQHHSPPNGLGEPAVKRPKVEGSDVATHHRRVVLNPADCGLDFDIEANGLHGSSLHEKGFAYCWSGARANVGIKGGKYCFGCKILSEQVVDMDDTPVDQQHLSRVGISRGDDSVASLGETVHSFGFGGTGKFSSAGKFLNYGEKFGVGDIIICAVDLEKEPLATVGFSKNGKWLGIAKEFDARSRGLDVVHSQVNERPWESALFPHVLLKNVTVELLVSTSDDLTPIDGYKPWISAIEDGNAIFGPSFSRPDDCEVIMMVGLPASGKTTWAERRVLEHPGKRYMILGTNLALDLMKVPGLLRKHNYGQRFELLMDRATGIFNTLLARAAKTPRNYIIDQTNVYKSARIRKLKSFMKYRKIAVVIFTTPDELKSRAAKRFEEMGKEVPADAINEMIANFVLPASKSMPGSTESFDEVIFPELGREEAQSHLDEMKRALPPPSMNKKQDIPFSCERTVHSFQTPLSNKGHITGFEGNRQTQSDVLFSDYSSPSQAIPAYCRPLFPSVHPSEFGESELPRFRNYENAVPLSHRDELDRFRSYNLPAPFQRSEIYGNFDRPLSFQRDDIGRQSLYSDSNVYDRRSSFGNSSSFGDMNPYQTPRSTDTFPRTSYECYSPINRPYGYLPTTPPFSGRDGQGRDPGPPHFTQNGSPYAPPYARPSPGFRDARPRTDYSPHSWNR